MIVDGTMTTECNRMLIRFGFSPPAKPLENIFTSYLRISHYDLIISHNSTFKIIISGVRNRGKSSASGFWRNVSNHSQLSKACKRI